MKTNIIDILNKYKDDNIIYIPNPGNAGDSLIALGTLFMFDKLELNYTIGDINTKYNNQILFYAGGGNLVGIYNNCKQFILNNQDNNQIVLLPHTVKDETKLIKRFKDNIIIICREDISYNYVKNNSKYKHNIYLSDDMAFYISLLSLGIDNSIIGIGECNCFRTDSEKTSIKIPTNNNDISKTLNKSNNTSDKKSIIDVCTTFFNYLAKYDTINTNRLHIAIAGCLLNKKVNLYANSYYKNKAIYDTSLKNKYNIIFHN
jgi:exopolysaccharide biosynthesis predicted pyruvyltransferase EpsI